MATPMQRAIQNIVQSYLTQQLPTSRKIATVQTVENQQVAVGQVSKVDKDRRSVTMLLADGSEKEHFQQNRWAREGDFGAAWGNIHYG